MIGDVVGEVDDQKNLRVVLEVVIVIDAGQFPDLDQNLTQGREVVVVQGHLIDIEDIDVAGSTEILNFFHFIVIKVYCSLLR